LSIEAPGLAGRKSLSGTGSLRRPGKARAQRAETEDQDAMSDERAGPLRPARLKALAKRLELGIIFITALGAGSLAASAPVKPLSAGIIKRRIWAD
jgi:hypothetical protein